MSLGRSQARFVLCYVDELLANFTFHPQKSIQNVFQRLLVACGGEYECIALHVAENLLSALNIGRPAGQGLLNEPQAMTLIGLILKFATEEQKGRSEKEVKGAEALFTALSECCADELGHIIRTQGEEISVRFVESVNKIVGLSPNPQQCAFLVSMNGPDIAGFVEGMAEDMLNLFFAEHQTKEKKCTLRMEYIIRMLTFCCECNINTLSLTNMRLFILILMDDPERESLEKKPLQPLLYAFLCRRNNRTDTATYEIIMHQATDIVKRGMSSILPVQAARDANRRTSLAAAMLSDEGKYTINYETMKAFLNHVKQVIFVSPASVATAIVATTGSSLRIGAMKGHPDDGDLPWNPLVMAEVFNQEYQLNWRDVFKEIQEDVGFRIPSRAGLNFFHELLKAGFQRGFPMDLMYKQWPVVDGQIDFFQRVLDYRNVLCLDEYPHTLVDLSMLENAPPTDGWLYRNWKCLELLTTFILIEEKHSGTTGLLTDIITDFMDEGPDVLLMALCQVQVPATRFRRMLIKTAFEQLLLGHKNAFSAIQHVLYEMTEELTDLLKPQDLLLEACVEMHQWCRLTCSPAKRSKVHHALETLNRLDPVLVTHLICVERMHTAYEFALVADEMGYHTFDDWLSMRNEMDEVSLFTYLCEERYLTSTSTNETFTERILEFLAENKDVVKRLGLSSTSTSSKGSSVHSTPAKSASAGVSPPKSPEAVPDELLPSEDVEEAKVKTPSPVKPLTPSPQKEPTPSPQKEAAPQKEPSPLQTQPTSSPQKEATPSPQKPKIPSPHKEVTPSPQKEVTPSPQKEATPQKEPSPQKEATPQKEPTPSPQKPKTPSPQKPEEVEEPEEPAEEPPVEEEEVADADDEDSEGEEEFIPPQEAEESPESKPEPQQPTVSPAENVSPSGFIPYEMSQGSSQEVVSMEELEREELAPEEPPAPIGPPTRKTSQPVTSTEFMNLPTYRAPSMHAVPEASTSHSPASTSFSETDQRYAIQQQLRHQHMMAARQQQQQLLNMPHNQMMQQQMQQQQMQHQQQQQYHMPRTSMPPPPIGMPPGHHYDQQAVYQHMAMKESGRSSSVSSTGRAPLANFPPVPQDPRMQRQFSNSVSAPYNPLNSYMQQQPQAQSTGNPVGLNTMFGSNSFGGSQELIRAAAPSSVNFGANSPTNSRAPIPQPPQRQNSSTSCWSLPGNGPGQRPAGPPTPSQQIDFRAQLPPTGAQTDFQARANSNPQPQPQQPIFEDFSQMNFPEDVQEEANSYFEQIYTPNPGAPVLTVSILINRLKTFKTSRDAREQKVLACVVKNLFEEYRFFNEYPVRELEITAELYGGILREGIINEHNNLHFATAVRKVIESLSQPPESNLFRFGLVSLEHCRSKLCSYPKVCSMIASLETFKQFPKSTQEFVLAGMSGDALRMAEQGRNTPPMWQQQQQRAGAAAAAAPGENSSRSTSSNSAPAQAGGRTASNVLSYTNVDTLVKATESDGAEVAQPAEVIVDKMSFLFNNLSQTNMGAKKEEVLTIINEQGEPFIKWLAQYIVMKRVSIEQNFQPLYNTFVQVLDHPLLDLHIKKETFRNIRILLRSDKRQAASNYSDRQLLKNLGSWLGSITIARSKPILITELDLKALLMEAYYKGQQELLFVVPFIAKILYSCSKTPIFGASCAWIRSILKILAELHNEPDLKINLKFEIEVLCKELSVDLGSLPMDGVLKDTDRLLRVQQQLSELKLVQRPDSLTSGSPIPTQMRHPAEMIPTPTNDTQPGTPAPDAAENAGGPPEPMPQSHFAYHDINVISYEGLAPHLQIRQNLPLFQLHPHLKQNVRTALTVAIKELIGPVSERAQKIAMTVTENLIRKDFALDGDEKNLKQSAFHMMRAMTAGMAMITCRDPLSTTMVNALQNSFIQSLRHSIATPDNAKMAEEAAQVITQDNVELATNFIVKTACEKATLEMEKRLEPEFQKRINARRDGGVFTDEAAEKIQAQLPAKIANPPGATRKELLEIYSQFSTRICGFKSSVTEENQADAPRPPVLLNDDQRTEGVMNALANLVKEIDNTLATQPHQSGNKAYNAIGVIRDLLAQILVNPKDPSVIGNYISKSVEHFLHAFHSDPKNGGVMDWSRRLRDLFNGVFRLLLSVTSIAEISKRVTATLINLNVDYKWNVEAVEIMYKNGMVDPEPYDRHLSDKITSGTNVDQATYFAQKLFRTMSHGENKIEFNIIKAAFNLTYEQLVRISQFQQQGNPRVPAPGAAGNTNSPLFFDQEPQENNNALSTKVVEGVLREWISLCYSPVAIRNPQEALSSMIHVMHEHGCLSTDEKISSFFKMCTEMCVDVTQRMIKQDPGSSAHQSTVVRQRCYYTLDAFVKLIALMIRFSDGTQPQQAQQTKITLLKKVLSIVANVLTADHDARAKEFNAMPYHRIIITLFNELTSSENGNTLDNVQWSVLEAFGQALFLLQPRRVPMFAYAWLDIVGHRNVIGKLLGGAPENPESIKMSAMYTQLIICHLKFLSPFLRNIQLPKSVAMLYKGTLRVLLVILHDFPELLCEFHYVICDTIPANCVQLRNLVLSAYPRNMRLPDPFALNFKQVDSIADMAQEPKSNLNMSTIIPEAVRTQLEDYLATRTNVDFLTALPGLLQMSTTPGMKYNTTVLNAVVLYVGIKAIENLHQKRSHINIQTIAHTSYMDVFQNLAVQLCTEGRYLLFNAIANQLRYPNAHTHYFSCVFLFLFLNSDCDAIQEQITRILFERLVALRPHPWGLLITFIELIKNPAYNFWKYEFTRCAPEIERLFQNVANTCVPSSRATAEPSRT